MNARIFKGSLICAEGSIPGEYVTLAVALNLQHQIDILREGIAMLEQAQSLREAQEIARDLLAGHTSSIAALGTLQ